ncbi:MAG: mandelate racemase/muconate lactonizing enzyme family protein [Spirochaetaceae bacterium]
MQIQEIATFVLKMPLGARRFYSSQAAFPERNSFLVRLTTDTGLVGWGEGGQYGPAEPVASFVEDVFAPWILGKDPMMVGALWEQNYARTRDFGRKSAAVEAISALDIAMWDLKGQALGVSLSDLAGGRVREEITAYATGCYYTDQDLYNPSAAAERAAREAESYAEAGFPAVKIKLGLLSLHHDIARSKAIRDALGAELRVMADANHAYDVPSAKTIGHALGDLGYGWFEEPVVPEDLEGYAELRAGLSIPIAGGECEYTRFGFKELLTRRCCDILQPDISASGGFSEALKIHALASAFGVRIVPHVWGSGIAVATALQFLSTLPVEPYTANPLPFESEPVIEFDRNPNALRDDLVDPAPRLVDGRIPVPEGPGLGVKVRDDVLSRYTTRTRTASL